ncbi:hypothetical protein EYD00_25695 (plasmid) [Agrobacterium sp. 33MFTa1.1]|uniref:hypothetical protein n=1 Tax=Agrobacterium sp. 33MFTa1.1 TaxID=1279031 RepID=UPI0005586005|nr:hypothetical protein [Agrobacterium sp. 33MFTa1.1]QBJ16822.1 hypothetical protein EYD00_25695 [Agrobacterium sp. 33MFTa1.1]
MIIGYHASHEQFAPHELLSFIKLAEQAGFNAVKLGLDLAQKQEIAELQEDVTPEGVLDTIDKISGGANGRSEGRGPEGNV